MIPRRFFWLFDVAVLVSAFLGTYVLVESLNDNIYVLLLANWRGQLPPIDDLAWILMTATPVTLIVLGFLGNHESIFDQSRTRIVVGGVLGPLSALGVISLALFALKNPNWSRLFIFSFTLFSAAGFVLYRLCYRTYCLHCRALGHHKKNVVLIGSVAATQSMITHLKQDGISAQYKLYGRLAISVGEDLASVNARLLGTVDDLGSLLINEPIEEVIVVHPVTGGEWLTEVIRHCDYFGVVLRIIPEAILSAEPRFLHILHRSPPLNLPALVLASPHWNSEALFLKRLIDILGSAILLILLAPLFLIIAIAIKVANPKLPVFYPWRVVGRNGIEFTGYKFTTMVPNADELKDALRDRNEMQGPVFKIKDDPRITPLGRFLRKYSLNELPQLWSVLKGDMSLVGPRPAFRHELDRYESWQKRKLSINPGLTCLWQIRGRNKISRFDDWVLMDLEYIDNWSLWLDFKIMIRTAWVVIAGTGS
jgi:exopolysaccharide biosynthesis polyprenyl glycosylphosphotransferase